MRSLSYENQFSFTLKLELIITKVSHLEGLRGTRKWSIKIVENLKKAPYFSFKYMCSGLKKSHFKLKLACFECEGSIHPGYRW